jgi:hypothetical protein
VAFSPAGGREGLAGKPPATCHCCRAAQRARNHSKRHDENSALPVVPARILPTIVISQFAATSLWFAGNAVMPDLQRSAGLPASSISSISPPGTGTPMQWGNCAARLGGR